MMSIKSSVRNYEAHFHPDLDGALSSLKDAENLFTIVDTRVLELYQKVIGRNLKGQVLPIEATEENKSFERSGEFVLKLLDSGCRKNSQLLVIGGGVLQDIGGFLASVLFRGIEWTLVPTTLLAQCDSCIGSKTSMNIARYKNQLGTFYPPKTVLLPNDVLATLEPHDLDSGVCEAVKLAMIDGSAATGRMIENLGGGLTPKRLQPVIEQALQIKKSYIEEDEFDRGRRNLLNYGHTFGHAFETVSNYAVPHGIAVGLGMEAACFFSWKLGHLPKENWLQVRTMLEPWCGRFRADVKRLSPSDLMKAMKSDKKSSNHQVGFILTEGFGKMKRQFVGFEDSQRLLTEFLAD